jgi:hypothetical protein
VLLLLLRLFFRELLSEAEEEAAGATARGTIGVAETTPTGKRIRNVQRSRKNVIVVERDCASCLRGRNVLGNMQ